MIFIHSSLILGTFTPYSYVVADLDRHNVKSFVIPDAGLLQGFHHPLQLSRVAGVIHSAVAGPTSTSYCLCLKYSMTGYHYCAPALLYTILSISQ